jgi:hypothetical protein
MPEPIDILEGKVKDLKVKEVSAMYSLTISMCYEMRDMVENQKRDKKKMDEVYDNFLEFTMNNFETELIILGARIALQQFGLDMEPSRLKNFDEFHKKYGKLVLEAVK